jgi:hypothetical protein
MDERGIFLAALGGAWLLVVVLGAAGRAPRSFRRRRPYPEVPVKPFGLIDAVQERLARTPFDRMSPAERRLVRDLLWRADAHEVDDAVHAGIHSLLSDLALRAGRRDEAGEHALNAQRWDPRARREAA